MVVIRLLKTIHLVDYTKKLLMLLSVESKNLLYKNSNNNYCELGKNSHCLAFHESFIPVSQNCFFPNDYIAFRIFLINCQEQRIL